MPYGFNDDKSKNDLSDYVTRDDTTVFASKSHTHKAGDITSGTLAIARGGTAATQIETILPNQFVSPAGATSGTADGDVVKWGRLVQFHLIFTVNKDLAAGDIVNTTLANIIDPNNRPLAAVALTSGGSGAVVSGFLGKGGALAITATSRAIASGTDISLGGMYITAK